MTKENPTKNEFAFQVICQPGSLTSNWNFPWILMISIYNIQINTININDDEWVWYIYSMLSGHLLIYWVSSLFVYLYQLQGYQYHVISFFYPSNRFFVISWSLNFVIFYVWVQLDLHSKNFYWKMKCENFLEKVNCKEINLHVLSNTKR